jgi:hypothetical protein
MVDHSYFPDFLRELANPPKKPASRVPVPIVVPSEITERQRRYSDAVLRREVEGLAATAEGSRDDNTNKSSFRVGRYVGGGFLDRGCAEAELLNACVTNGLVADNGKDKVLDTIRRGMEAGMKAPLSPPDDERSTTSLNGPPDDGVPFSTPDQFADGEDQYAPEPEGRPDMSLLGVERDDPVPVLPLEDFFGDGSPWVDWIKTAANAKQTSPDYVMFALIAVLSSLIGNTRRVAPNSSWSEAIVVWSMLIGDPSAGKSPAIDAVMDVIQEYQRELSIEDEEDHKVWEEASKLAKMDLKSWEADYKAIRKENAKARRAGKEEQPLPEKPKSVEQLRPEPVSRLLYVNDITTEKSADLMAVHPRGLLYYRDELAGIIANMSRYSGGDDKPFFIEAYGGRMFVQERMTRSAHVAHLSIWIIGGIQPDRLSELLIKMEDDGYLVRHLPIYPLKPAPVRPTKAVDKEFLRTIIERLYGLKMVEEEGKSPRPWYVRFSPAAQDVIYEFSVWAAGEETNLDGLMKSYIGKFKGFAVRLSLILAYLEWAVDEKWAALQMGPVPPEEITQSHIGRACHLAQEYLYPMGRRAYADASVPKTQKAAQALAKLIHTERIRDFTIYEITRRKRQWLRSQPDVQPAVEILIDAKWLKRHKLGTTKRGGRPTEKYIVNPRIWEVQS